MSDSKDDVARADFQAALADMAAQSGRTLDRDQAKLQALLGELETTLRNLAVAMAELERIRKDHDASPERTMTTAQRRRALEAEANERMNAFVSECIRQEERRVKEEGERR